ncbi:MAG: DUF99 family protein [Nanoarchaeota archaeon]|nr:DUF99 family protein [Nanoarchaeota archaeon]
MKKEIRVLGLDDSPFELSDKECLVIGTFFRGGTILDGVLSTKVAVDGEDATAKIISAVNRSKFKPQIQAIFLDGIAVGGFNVINIHALQKYTGLPVIVIIRKKPDFKALEKTLKKLGMEKKYQLMEKAGTPQEVKMKKWKLYIQTAGISMEKATELLEICCTHSSIPEAIRAAHLIGAGMVKGESKGKA